MNNLCLHEYLEFLQEQVDHYQYKCEKTDKDNVEDYYFYLGSYLAYKEALSKCLNSYKRSTAEIPEV